MTPRKTFALAAVLTMAFLLFARIGAAQERKGGTYTKIPMVKGIDMLKPGAKAPDFTVLDLAGRPFHLAEAAPKDAVVLFFWSYFCEPCREEFPMIGAVAKEYEGKGIQVVGVVMDGREMKPVIEKLAASENVLFRIVFDELDDDQFRVADPYGVSGTPALFVIDRKGTVSFSAVGLVAPETLRKEIAKVAK